MWSFEKLFGESFSSGDERKWLGKTKGECVSESGQSFGGCRVAEPPYFEEPLKKKLERRRRKFARHAVATAMASR